MGSFDNTLIFYISGDNGTSPEGSLVGTPVDVAAYDVFVNVTMPDKSDPQRLYKSDSQDFRVKPGSAAIDKGVVLPTINDDFTGRAPDLGAYELDRPLPHYGPR